MRHAAPHTSPHSWADAHTYLEGDELSVEVPLEEVLAAASAAGLELLAAPGFVDTTYADSGCSMMRTSYRCAVWAMRKRAAA